MGPAARHDLGTTWPGYVSITALAAVNVLRTPGRALVGAISLAVGVSALTMLTAVIVAFRGVLVGSLLAIARALINTRRCC